MTEKNILHTLAAQIRRIEEQRDAAAVRIEQASQRLEITSDWKPNSPPQVPTGGEAAFVRTESLDKESLQESPTAKVTRNITLGSNWIEETQKHGEQDEHSTHLERYEQLAEERYDIEVQIEQTLGKLAKSLKRLKALDANQRREAKSASIPVEHTLSRLVEGRLSKLLKGWMLTRVVKPTEIYTKPLYEIDKQAKRPKVPTTSPKG
ncbi:MAG: hypothetical protein JOZ19_05205 [Rubrobacter sp.]|nr:hypothetical protein [Rubrobacter sp.]